MQPPLCFSSSMTSSINGSPPVAIYFAAVFIDARRRCSISKKPHMCQCVCYCEGTLKQFNAPSARKLKTNQHVESFQPLFLHKEAILLLPCCYSQTPRHVRNTTVIPKRHTVYTLQQKIERISTGPAQTTKTSLLSPHPSPLLSRPVHGER